MNPLSMADFVGHEEAIPVLIPVEEEEGFPSHSEGVGPAPRTAQPKGGNAAPVVVAPLANSLGATTVSVGQPIGRITSVDLHSRIAPSKEGPAPQIEKETVKVYRRSPVLPPASVAFWSMETANRVIQAIEELFQYYFTYYVMTWGKDAEVIDIAVDDIRRQTYVPLESIGSKWLRNFQTIQKHREMIAYFLGDRKESFFALVDLMRERMIDEKGTIRELERTTFIEELQMLDQIIHNPHAAQLEQIEVAPRFHGTLQNSTQATAKSSEVKVAEALRDGFRYLQARLSEGQTRLLVDNLIFRTLYLMKETTQKFPERSEDIMTHLKLSLSVDEVEIYDAVVKHREPLGSSIGSSTIKKLVSYLEQQPTVSDALRLRKDAGDRKVQREKEGANTTNPTVAVAVLSGHDTG